MTAFPGLMTGTCGLGSPNLSGISTQDASHDMATINTGLRQVSSRTVDLIEHGRRKFRQDWLKLPRVANAPQHQKRKAWRGFSNNFSEHLVWEVFSALNKFDLRHAGKSAHAALRLHQRSF